jgi:putative phage-type endonuclease
VSAIVPVEQRSTAWHAHRALHANASEAATVMDASPWEPDTWYKLWQLKTGRAPRHGAAPFLRRGADMEAGARAAYERFTGNTMQPMVLHKDGWLSASLDGISFHGDVLVEIKCPTGGRESDTWQQALAGTIPVHYHWQLQHQLYVSGVPLAHFWVFDGEQGLLVEAGPQVDDQDRLLKVWREFWWHIEQDTPPALTERDTLVREDAEWIAAAAAYKAAKDALQRAQASMAASRKALIDLACHPRVAGGGVAVTRFWQDGRINYASIPELQEIELDNYRGPKTEQVRVTAED